MTKFGPPKGKENLLSYVLKYKSLFIISSIAGIIYNTVIVLGPILLGNLIDASGNGDKVLLSALYFVGVTVFFQFSRFIKRWYMRDQFNHIACDLRQTLLERTLKRKVKDLDKETVGDLMSRTVGDITMVVDTVMSTINEGWDTWLLMISYFVVLMHMDFKITLIASLLVPVTLVLAHLMRTPLYNASLGARKSAATANTGLQRYLSAISVLRLFGRETKEASNIMDAYKQQVKYNTKQILLQQAMLPIYALLAGLGVVLVIGLGGNHVRTGYWSVGNFNAFMVMFIAFTGRTRVAARVFNRWHGARAAWVRVKEKMSNNIDYKQLPTIEMSPKEVTTLRVKELSFGYNDQKVIESLSFEAKLGEIIGVTGSIGSGKSALLNVLCGQYDYEGSITINDIDLRDLSQSSVQNMISYSGHEHFMFSMGLAENITMGEKVNRDEARLTMALKASALSDDIARFDQGLDTELGERGVRVSGGQRQRISMARAVYGECPIVLLDDPFSALDVATEERIINSLRELLKDRIVIISSHRLNSFKAFDKIILLDKGSLLETGTHDDLMRSDGLYKEIYDALQFMKGVTDHE